MGITVARLNFKEHRKTEKFLHLDFLPDCSAVYSLVPSKTFDALNIDPYKSVDFLLANGNKISRNVSSGYFEYNRAGGPAPVIWGEESDKPLPGVTTLESFGLSPYPLKRELQPIRKLLATLNPAEQLQQ